MKTSSELLPERTIEVEGFLAGCRALVDVQMDQLLPRATLPPESVHRAIRWSVFAGGKRFRPALMLAAGKALGAGERPLLPAACALEMIHTYSLIHDDLPSMDDDDLRRGRPTCHIQFDEATAILAGDALQTLAFRIISEDELLPAQTRMRLISELANAAGTPEGMIAGQAYDLESESRQVTTSELEQIHRLKTGALIIAAVRCGAIIADSDKPTLASLTRYAAELGLLFQITDDLLDVTATAEALGKTPGKDARSQKATYATFYGIDAARKRALQVHGEACAALAQIKLPTDQLRSIADFILNRNA